MNTANAIAVGLLLSSFALLGTWAGTVGNVSTHNASLQSAKDVAEKAGPACPYEDQTGGMGGQAGSCSFDCGPGSITLSVSADDEDAGVSGSGSCGDGSLHCTGEGSCDDTQATTTGGAGTCSGDSDEAVDSGLYVSCSGNGRDDPKAKIPQNPTPECPVVVEPSPPYPRICLPPDLARQRPTAGELPLVACRIVRTDGESLCSFDPMVERPDAKQIEEQVSMMSAFILEHFETSPGTVSAHVFAVKGITTGLLCWGYDCLQRAPSCTPFEVKGERTRCEVG